jgi:hypothetical protein
MVALPWVAVATRHRRQSIQAPLRIGEQVVTWDCPAATRCFLEVHTPATGKTWLVPVSLSWD